MGNAMTPTMESDARLALRRLYRRYKYEAEVRHLHAMGNPLVPGDGPIRPRLMFVGEAPGAQEVRARKPFVGASGKFLNEMLASVGIERQEVFITNVVKFRPPENRDPTTAEVHAGIPYLRREHRLLGCPPIVVLGKHARRTVEMGYRLPEGLTIGLWFWMQADGGFPVLPLYHPAYGLYQAGNKPMMFEQFKAVLTPPLSPQEG